MHLTLRDYQEEAVNNIRNWFAKGVRRVLLQMPTGGGKTVVFSYMAMEAFKRGKNILIISHRTELLSQAGGTLSEFGLSSETIDRDTKRPPEGRLSVAMTGTLQRRIDKIEWKDWWDRVDMIIIDECHRSEFSWIDQYLGNKFKIGVTATPKRSGNMAQLADEYDKMVLSLDVQEMVNAGNLLPDRLFEVDTDITGVGKIGGEFNSSQLREAFGKRVIYEGLVRNLIKHAPDEITIVFCANISHAIETTIKLNESGLSAKFVVSRPSRPKIPAEGNKASETIYKRKMEMYDMYMEYYAKYSGNRDDVVQEWKDGKFNYLVNAGIFVEGFDHKPTQSVVILMATTSLNKWLQMIGRGSRLFEGKKFFKIFDFGMNAQRLGEYRAQREWSLLHKVSSGDGVPPTKTCPECDALVFASASICKYCGYEFPSQAEVREIELREREWDDPKELEAALADKKKAWTWRQIWIRGENEAFLNRDNEDYKGNGGLGALKEYAKKKKFNYHWAARKDKMYRANIKTK